MEPEHLHKYLSNAEDAAPAQQIAVPVPADAARSEDPREDCGGTDTGARAEERLSAASQTRERASRIARACRATMVQSSSLVRTSLDRIARGQGRKPLGEEL